MPSSEGPRASRDPIVVMGVAGSGKSTVGAELAAVLGVPFVDGDALHPPANTAKMAAGIPLDDADRAPWLDAVAEVLADAVRDGSSVVVACSALRRRYRDRLREAGHRIRFVWLTGSRELLAERLASRRHEFMDPTLLDSQLATLEAPGPDELAVALDIALPVDELVTAAVARLEEP